MWTGVGKPKLLTTFKVEGLGFQIVGHNVEQLHKSNHKC